MIYRNENNTVHFPVCNLLIVFIFISDRHKICGWSILSVEGAVCERSEPLYRRSLMGARMGCLSTWTFLLLLLETTGTFSQGLFAL